MTQIENEGTEISFPPEKLVFIPLGGATGVGMNFFLYGYKGKWLIVDFGQGFPGDDLPGIDSLLPNPQFLTDKKKDIVGLIVTHGHVDHTGAITPLWRDIQCPIYVTPFANELLESALNEAGLLGRATINVVQQGDLIRLDPFEIEMINVSHSLPEANALAIRTAAGTVVHTGDWRVNPDNVLGQETDFKRLKEIGDEGVLAMVCDSTNMFSEPNPHTEMDVRANLTRVIGQYPGKQIAVGCFASNVARVESIYAAAQANGREVCLLGRSLWRVDAAARATGYFKEMPEFLSEQEALERPIGSVLYICTGSQGEHFSALSTLAAVNPQKNSVYFGPEDVVIFSSRVIPGNEKSIAFLQKRLKMKGIKIITAQEEMIHVSGHYAGPDLEKMYKAVRPKIALPVHGEAMELTAHADQAEEWGVPFTFTLEDGEVLLIDDKNPEILGSVPAGVLAVDGKKIIPLDAQVIKKRRKMMDNGTVVATVVLNSAHEVLGEPQISTFGLLDEESTDKDRMLENIHSKLNALSDAHKSRDDMIQDAVKSGIRSFLNQEYGKKPLIEVHLVRI